jgi:hypothetical protein
MDAIFDFSAAPHLPLSLRSGTAANLRPEFLVAALNGESHAHEHLHIREQDGEIFIEFSAAA